MQTVIVIGGGASGMIAALTAAENPENRVILLERQQRVGRKLLATGNGRCNLTNTGAAPENYHGEHPDFAVPALTAFPPAAALDFFHSLGLVTQEEYGGRSTLSPTPRAAWWTCCALPWRPGVWTCAAPARPGPCGGKRTALPSSPTGGPYTPTS